MLSSELTSAEQGMCDRIKRVNQRMFYQELGSRKRLNLSASRSDLNESGIFYAMFEGDMEVEKLLR